MICLIALFVCGVLGLFSTRYRSLAKEAFRCVFLRVQFKPCDTQLDQKIKSKLSSKLLNRSPKVAKFVYKRFELLSLAFTIIFFVSLGYTLYGFYNLFTIGTCDPHSDVCPLSIKTPVCGCENICMCEAEVCESPDYQACEGNCSCQRNICARPS